MHVAINALAATRGGAVTMLGPFLSELRQLEPQWKMTVYVTNAELGTTVAGVATVVIRTEGWRRAWQEVFALGRRAHADGANVMLNLLNSGSLLARLPSITWQRNALYFDRSWIRRQPVRFRLEAGLRRAAALRTCRSSAVTIAPSRTMADYLRDWPQGAKLRIEVVPHGVDAARFAGVPENCGGSFDIGVIGHAARHRGLTTAVRVLHEVRSLGVAARLLLTVPRHGNSAFQETVDEAALTMESLGLGDHVVFGGAVADSAEWYRRLDLLLVPSECESFCFPVLEGLAFGLPIVTSGLPAHREIGGEVVLHGSDPREMAERVLQIYQEAVGPKQHRRELARNRAATFSWKTNVARVRDLILEVART